jgi:uncharacterized protein (TIGR02099 family)
MRLRKAGKILLYCFAGAFGLLLLLMLAVKLALDRAPAYQTEIKQWLHDQTGYHIAFADVSPSFRWYGPELHFVRLELRSKDDRRVLALAAGGRVAADIWQLLRSGKLLAGRIEIDDPTVAVARLGPSSFALASEINLAGAGDGSSLEALTLDDLPAGKLVIRHAVVSMQNWNASLPQLMLHDVNFEVRRGDEGLAVTLDAHLPPALGGTLNVRASARGRGGLQDLNWNALVKASDISFPGWRLLLPEYLSRLDAGSGAFELAARGAGPVLARADLDFAARGVATQLTDGPVAKFEQISGSLSVQHTKDHWTLTGRRVHAVRSVSRDPDSQFEVSWRNGAAGVLDLQAHASYLRTDTLLPLAGLLPDKQVRDRLEEYSPTGEWLDTMFDLTRSAAGAPLHLQIHARFRDAGFAPVGRAPGLRGLSGRIAGDESGGRVELDTHAAVFNWPLQLERPVDLDTLSATLYWKRSADELLVATPDWQMQNRDGGVHAKAAWRMPADGSPLLTLVGSIENANLADAHSYLPRAQLPAPALEWLEQAFIAGHLSRAAFVLDGPILHFPFRDGSGLFLVRCEADAATLQFRPDWPRLENLSGQAEFRNEGMTARLTSGRLGSADLASASVRFADFKTGELDVHVGASGDAADALSLLRATPLDAQAENLFSNVDAKGSLQTTVDLFLPLKDFSNRRVLVHGHLEGVTANRPGSTVAATDVTGDFDVDGAHVVRADVHGRLLGGPFQVQARAPRGRPPTRTQLDFHGTLSGDALAKALELPPTVVVEGQTEWRAVLKVSGEPTRERSLLINSNLTDLEMKLPAPLYKPADLPMPSWLEIQWPAAGGPQGRLGLGSVLGGSYALESDARGMRLAHLALTFGGGETGSNDAQIFNVGGSVARLDLAGWLKLIPTDNSAKPLSDYLRTATLNVAEVDYLGLAFRDVALKLAVGEGSLRIGVGGPNVSGTISLPRSSDSSAPWDLEFERLHVDVADDGAVDEPAVGEAGAPAATRPRAGDPRAIPAANFHAAELNLGERQFGDVHATLVKLDDGISVKQLTLGSPNLTVNATGEWRGPDAGVGRIMGTAISTDVQGALKQLGYAPFIEAKSGRVDFDLTWNGAPNGEDLAQAQGHVQIALDKGQIVGLNPGAGRVLGLTSVAALRRRLGLDFSDLTDKGLAFDTARGDLDLRDGNAYTDNVLVKGPAAEIGLIGRVGLKSRDYDQIAEVTGSVGNSLPLAALVGGPVVAGAVLVFTQVFKQPLKGLARGYYRITGSWDNPVVERIKSADAAAASAEAPK